MLIQIFYYVNSGVAVNTYSNQYVDVRINLLCAVVVEINDFAVVETR